MLNKTTPLLAALFIFITAIPSLAGARIDIDRGSYIELGFSLHTMLIMESSPSDDDNWQVSQARLNMKGVFNEYVMAYVQTDAAEGTMELIDAFVGITVNPLFNLYIGQNMAPASRQNLTSSKAMLSMARPAIAAKTLTWGVRAVPLYVNNGYEGSNPGLNDSINNRDTGLTIHGYHKIFSGMHVKYYLGLYEGIQLPDDDTDGKTENNLRFTGRVQVNLFDAEDQYYNYSNYLGYKKTVAIGASLDRQNAVAYDTSWRDYNFYTIDLFTEMPLGPGSITFETAYQVLELGGTGEFKGTDDQMTYISGKQASGTGYYVQAGYFIKNFQPWLLYETWDSDAGTTGGFYSIRGGISFYLKEHNANVKLGAEYFSPEGDGEDSAFSVTAGFFANY